MNIEERYDIVILGAGLAGLALCRQILLNANEKTILILAKNHDFPENDRMLGESLVQIGGYYFARLLDLEEHLLREHYPKYNLRFHWKTPERKNGDIRDYSRTYIGKTPEVASYQIDRNKIEKHLLDLNLQNPNVTLCVPVAELEVDLSEKDLHSLKFRLGEEHVGTRAEWVIDTEGNGAIAGKKRVPQQPIPMRHGSSWCWVEGLMDVETLSEMSLKEIRIQRDSQRQGFLPSWLATNHFCGEGYWLSVIPLKGVTCIGVVFDTAAFKAEKVSSAEKLIEWACKEFPLFGRALPKRRIIGSRRLSDPGSVCRQSISSSRWAVGGMPGRFSNSLYSPGSDLIALCNTIVVDAILEKDAEQLNAKAEIYGRLMRTLHDAYVPSCCTDYDALGDQEVFTLKYAWDLAAYFCFNAFPFLNGLFTCPQFIGAYFRVFEEFDAINGNLQKFLGDYYRWKRNESWLQGAPKSKDLLELTSLKRAESSYYRVGLTPEQAELEIGVFLRDMKEFARFIYAYICSIVLNDNQALLNRAFVDSIKLGMEVFNPALIREIYTTHVSCSETFDWGLDPFVMESFRGPRPDHTAPASSQKIIDRL